MKEGSLKVLQRLGENTAYTFKELYKESDWLERKYKFCLSVPIIFSFVALVFHQKLPDIGISILAAISLFCTFVAWIEQKKLASVGGYRSLANEIKTIYDRAEEAYHLEETDNISNLREQWTALREQTQRYPIGLIGRYVAKRAIKKEMNLSWLGGKYSEQSPAFAQSVNNSKTSEL